MFSRVLSGVLFSCACRWNSFLTSDTLSVKEGWSIVIAYRWGGWVVTLVSDIWLVKKFPSGSSDRWWDRRDRFCNKLMAKCATFVNLELGHAERIGACQPGCAAAEVWARSVFGCSPELLVTQGYHGNTSKSIDRFPLIVWMARISRSVSRREVVNWIKNHNTRHIGLAFYKLWQPCEGALRWSGVGYEVHRAESWRGWHLVNLMHEFSPCCNS